MKLLILLTYIFASIGFCQAQRLNTIYYGVSSDSLYGGHRLKFFNDTTLEISTFPPHMSHQFKMTLNYKKKGKTIKIYSDKISSQDSIALVNHRLKQFFRSITFTLDKNAIIDTSSKIVYVRYNDFKKKYYLIYIIDGITYKQETGLTDAYGIIKNNPKENKVLNDKLTSIKDNLDNYTINVYKGLNAYNKFGYDCVFGVIELQRKN